MLSSNKNGKWRPLTSLGHCCLDLCPTNPALMAFGGSDGVVCVVNLKTKQRTTVCEAKDPITSIAYNHAGTQLAIGSSDHSVQLFDVPHDGPPKFEKIITKLTLPVTHVQFSPDDEFVAVAGEDSSIKLVNVLDTTQLSVLKGHSGSVRSVAFDPTYSFLASSGADGTVRIWDVATGTPKQCYCIEDAVPEGEGLEQTSRVAWNRTGSKLAVPSARGVSFYSRGTWELDLSNAYGEHKGPASAFRFSKSGSHGVSLGASDCQAFVWDCGTRESVGVVRHHHRIIDAAWHSTQNVLALLDDQGQWFRWKNAVPPAAAAAAATPRAASTPNDDATSAPNALQAKRDLINSLFDDEAEDDGDDADDEGDDDGSSVMETRSASSVERVDFDALATREAKLKRIEQLKKQMEEKKRHLAQMKKERLEQMAAKKQRKKKKRTGASTHHPEEGSEESIHDEDVDEDAMEDEDEDVVVVMDPAHAAPRSLAAPQAAPPQPPFQPNASPMDHTRRFLAWSLMGSITSRKEFTSGVIEVEFADASGPHRNFSITNTQGFTMAALGKHGVLLACQMSDNFPSLLFYRPFSSWERGEWTLKMPEDEQVEAIVAGSYFVAAATNKDHLRIMRHSGIQTMLLSLPGPVVTMAMTQDGSDVLAVVYHASPPIQDTQSLEMMVFDLEQRDCVVPRTRVPLSRPGGTLRWLGFGAARKPVALGRGETLPLPSRLYAYDSAGAVRQFNPSELGGSWVPTFDFADVRAGDAEGHWVLGISAGEVVCVSTEDQAAPSPIKRPIPTTWPLSMPLVDRQGSHTREAEHVVLAEALRLREDKAHAEAVLAGGAEPHTIAAVQRALLDRTKEQDKNVLRLYGKLVEEGKLVGALDACAQIMMMQGVVVAERIAKAQGERALLERVHQLRMEQEFVKSNDSAGASGGSGDAHRATSASLRARKRTRGASPASPAQEEEEDEEEEEVARYGSEDSEGAAEDEGSVDAEDDVHVVDPGAPEGVALSMPFGIPHGLSGTKRSRVKSSSNLQDTISLIRSKRAKGRSGAK